MILSIPDSLQDELFGSRLENLIDINRTLAKLGKGIDWEIFDLELANTTARKWKS